MLIYRGDVPLIIPPDQLSEEVLTGILEAYINRDGTDYGAIEMSLSEKVAYLRPQVMNGHVLIVYDEETSSVNLLPKREYGEHS